MGSPQARQGRGDAAAEQDPHSGTDRGSSPQHAQNHGPAAGGTGGPDTPPAGKAKGRGKSPKAKTKAKAKASGKTALDESAERDQAIPKAPSGPGSRLHLQNWRISTRLVSLLTLPVVAATTLGGFRINDSMNEIAQLDHMQLLTTMTRQATNLAAALQEERDKSAGPLSVAKAAAAANQGAPPAPANSLVEGVRDQTDAAATAFASATDKIDSAQDKDDTLKSIRNNVLQIGRQLAGIEDIRKKAYQNSAQQTVSEYNGLIVSLLSLSQDMAQATSSPEMIKRTRALAAFSSAKEYASIQRAVIAAALPETGDKPGKLSENDRLYALAAQRGESQAKKTFELVYQGKPEELLQSLGDGNSEIGTADHYARRVLTTEGQFGKEKNRSWMDWYDADDTKLAAMKVIELTLLDDMEQKARELKTQSQQDAIINGALILLVLGVSLVGAFVMARSMIRSLRRLQDTATRVAQERLPELVKQLSETDPQDVDTSVESVGVHSRDEIGQVAAAFDDVHREAVRLAAEQALLRGNVNAMFTNLSRRSQGLIQRQLSLISELESREADPDQLSSLFKLDHLATRMRRNGENLLVLAGEEPGRRWTRPVPLVDVLRAAASEVEQYERIELSSVPGTDVAGRVVNDLVHLLAELLENATSFSSPQTKVKVTGHALPDGRVLVEIHDTGIGLSPEDLAAINERLASPPTVDVSVSRRMGLFVVGRLSLRHGIRIQLRPSDSGGTTALVMLPVDVAQGGKKPAPMPGQGGPGIPGAAGQQGAVAGQGARPPVGAAPQRGQVTGGGQRAALPGRENSGQQRPQGQQGQQNQQGGRGQQQGGRGQAPQGQGAFGAGAPVAGRGAAGGPQARPGGAPNGATQSGTAAFPQSDPFGPGTTPGGPQGNHGFERPQSQAPGQPGQGQGAPVTPRVRPQLPPRGGAPRPELPGAGTAASAGLPPATSWGADPGRRGGQDVPRGHDEVQGPGSTAEFARPDFNAPMPRTGDASTTGQFARPEFPGPQDPASTGQYPVADLRGAQDPSGTGQFARPAFPAAQDPSSTGQFARPEFPGPQDPASTGQFARPDFPQSGTGQFERADIRGPQDPSATGQFARPDFAAPRTGGPGGPGVGGYGNQGAQQALPAQQAPQQYQPQQPQALPPAQQLGDGRTPLFDNLESNWFRQEGEQPPGQAPAVPQQPQQGLPTGPTPVPASPQRPQQPLPQRGQERAAEQPGQNPAPGSPTVSWRSSPNDELMRQAERVRQPAAGGITTSGLPRRVPRANLVAGTAQQQAEAQAGPQVSRAPDDVRGRLTNLRRGIQQGRQAGTTGPATGSYHIDPTYQQER
ncbi:nitrate- and nitrite sensing domain-containing protein [Streptomyces sp. NBC_00536]|nr:nitrate- and nitrite sensing domain-containing protein [Streptomyces sp. NBC_00536]WUC81489.1 nitrate- and nitrite sensing domain-containing protein [Streptomyces sp. NBC_00536]